MLHVYFGKGSVEVRKKAFVCVRSYEEKGFVCVRIEAENYVQGMCADIAKSMSLFGEKTVYLLDTPSASMVFTDDIQESLEAFAQSSNAFVVIEGGLLAPAKKSYTKYAETLEEVEGIIAERFNVFALADSLSNKDKKTLWLQLQDAFAEGLSSEEIIGTLWWQLKTLRLAKLTNTVAESGMKEYPYNKAKRSLSNFKEGELESLSQRLLTLYHDGHLGKVDIELALEKWCLTL